MARTIRRQPFNVSTDSDDYARAYWHNQINFKGLCDKKNDVVIDAESFADVKNVYMSENNLLVSRPPIKFDDGKCRIIDQWTFGEYTLRLSRAKRKIEGDEEIGLSISRTYMLECLTHETDNEVVLGKFPYICFSIPEGNAYDVPCVTCVPIEDKIFIWLAGFDLFVFNLSGEKPYFEYANKYLYLPIRELIVNGFTTINESENFLTESYIRRYQYSNVSNIDFVKLQNKKLQVSLENKSGINELYDIDVVSEQSKLLLYPFNHLGTNYNVDVVQTPRATVFLRYDASTQRVAVSFDGKYFKTLPFLENILDMPMLTKDGFWVIAFTKMGVARCRLVAQETDDFIYDERLFAWTIDNYCRKYRDEEGNPIYIDTDVTPRGYFETVDTFMYAYNTDRGSFVYAEWLSGVNGNVYLHERLDDEPFVDATIRFKVNTPSIRYSTAGISVNCLYTTQNGSSWKTYIYDTVPDNINRTLQSGDKINITKYSDYYWFIYRMSKDGKFLADGNITSGDIVMIIPFPLEVSNYKPDKTYKAGDCVAYSDYIYKCLVTPTNVSPASSLFWEIMTYAGEPVRVDGIDVKDTVYRNGFLKTEATLHVSWKAWFMAYLNERYIIEGDNFSKGQEINLYPYRTSLYYNPLELVDTFGGISRVTYIEEDGSETTTTDESYLLLYRDGLFAFLVDDHMFSGASRLFLPDVGKPTVLRGQMELNLHNVSYITDCERCDLQISAVDVIDTSDTLTYTIAACYFDADTAIRDIRLMVISDEMRTTLQSRYLLPVAYKYKFVDASNDIVTDKYIVVNDELFDLPTINKEISVLSNNLMMGLSIDQYYSQGKIHRVTTDGIALLDGSIVSGDLVIYSTETDYLSRGARFRIYKLDASGNIVYGEPIYNGDLIKLTAYSEDIMGPDFNVEPLVYPDVPENWQLGDDWPESFPPYKPAQFIEGVLHYWKPGDILPVGIVSTVGKIDLSAFSIPLAADASGFWYNIGGTLWTSQLFDDTLLLLDEYVNVDENKLPICKPDVPTCYSISNTEYFAFDTDESHLLEIAEARYDEKLLRSQNRKERLLYLPKDNEQKFVSKITNLHPLSDTQMGIFLSDSIWYISTTMLESQRVYTNALKSKIPLGCKDGCDVVTALDGQAIIFATSRGVAALAPQDFIATTEKTLSYLSDNIQEKYTEFYGEKPAIIVDGISHANHAHIKIVTYRYWLLFYRKYSREILALDTRDGAWWVWETQYPISKINIDTRLHLLMDIHFSDKNTEALDGVQFIWCDDEIRMSTNEASNFLALNPDTMTYRDDIVPETLNGKYVSIYENAAIGSRLIFDLAQSRIDWHLVSQKLYFNQINNYKAVKALSMSVKGVEEFIAKLSIKAFRDIYHPEYDDVIEVAINDLRTFLKRVNILHVVNFQYRLENTDDVELSYQLRLNTLGIKYEVKERLR